ncbi:hypothetical protein JL100_032705 (plasmid) [Skermanella mucosa]|uniref:hypothetical protein n=1 Tax=Skermanella mucosa TaxID=1789672 RepID=UPI00192C363C|nr:hypothetical protein [Skermanella mucosa]UEM24386.1 hypothetical protein JL100_032705 [Skermanella mucosa]
MKRSIITVITFSFLTTACAGRDAAPVSAYNAYDAQLSCSQIDAETAANSAKVVQLQQEKDNARTANIAIGAVGLLLFWPALFALDTSDAQDVEMRALNDRNNSLAYLKTTSKCTATQTVNAVPSNDGTLPVSAASSLVVE